MNISQLSEQLKDVPQGTLVGYAKNPNSVVPQFLALAEIQRRQHLQAQAPAPTGTVADDVLAQANPVPQQMMPQQMAPQQVDPRVLQAQAMQQQAQQLPENQPGVAQLPTGMPQGMASGGIVAFAGGGSSMLEDDDDEDKELERLFPGPSVTTEDIMALAQRAKSGVRSVVDRLPQSYDQALAAKQASSAPSSVGIKDLIANAASKHNLPPEFLNRIAGIESGGDPNAINKTGSTAKGLFGFLDSTWKGYGVNPEDRSKPEVQAEYGAKLARDNAEFLKKKLGRDPSYHEVYAANYFGPTGAASLLRQDPNTSMKTALSSFESPKRVDLIMQQNPNLRGKTVGEVINGLRGKMGEGIVGLAHGGAVQHFATGDEVRAAIAERQKAFDVVQQNLPDSPSSDYAGSVTSWMESPEGIKQLRDRQIAMEAIRNNMPIPKLDSPYQAYTPKTAAQVRQERTDAKVAAENKESNKPTPKVNPELTPYKLSSAEQDIANAMDSEDANFNKPLVGPIVTQPSSNAPTPGGVAPPGAVAPKSKSDLIEEMLSKNLESQIAEAAQNKKMQLGLSLLGAGAAGLQSGSRYLGQNLGSSLAGGVNTYGALKKQEQDQNKDILGTQLGLYKYAASKEQAIKNAEALEKYREASLGLKPTEEERARDKFNLALSRNPQMLELNRLITEEQKAGMLTPERYAQYQANIGLITQALAKQYNVTPDVFVPMKPVTDPTKVKKEWSWNSLNPFSSSAPDKGATGVDPNNPLLSAK
jgi:hypothetical protein